MSHDPKPFIGGSHDLRFVMKGKTSVNCGSKAAFLAFTRLTPGNGLASIAFASGSKDTTPKGFSATLSGRSPKFIQRCSMAIRSMRAIGTEFGFSLLTRAISDEQSGRLYAYGGNP
jgi:hypothetical protein